MKARLHPVRRCASSRGFTLIEIMIAVLIVGVLAMVAFPAYQDSVRKGRRSEAFAALAALQQAQERWRGNKADYAGNDKLAVAKPDGLGLAATTPSGYYSVAISDASATGYTATATGQGGQANDTACKLLAVRVAAGNLSYGSGNASVDWADPGRCWAR